MAGDQVDSHDPMRPPSAFGFSAPSPRSPGHSALSFGISDAYTVFTIAKNICTIRVVGRSQILVGQTTKFQKYW